MHFQSLFQELKKKRRQSSSANTEGKSFHPPSQGWTSGKDLSSPLSPALCPLVSATRSTRSSPAPPVRPQAAREAVGSACRRFCQLLLASRVSFHYSLLLQLHFPCPSPESSSTSPSPQGSSLLRSGWLQSLQGALTTAWGIPKSLGGIPEGQPRGCPHPCGPCHQTHQFRPNTPGSFNIFLSTRCSSS